MVVRRKNNEAPRSILREILILRLNQRFLSLPLEGKVPRRGG